MHTMDSGMSSVAACSPTTKAAVGDRFLFRSNHTGNERLTGQPCTLVAIYEESMMWPYAVRFDTGSMSVAVDRELSPITTDGSVGEPLRPAPKSRQRWDAFLMMREHEGGFFVHPDGNVWPSIVPPTRDEVIASAMRVPVTISWKDGRRRTYKPEFDEATRMAGRYGLDAIQPSDESNAALTEMNV